MTHNDFCVEKNIADPIKKFLRKLKIKAYDDLKKVFKIKFPDYSIKDSEKSTYSAKMGVIRRYFQNY